MVTANSLLCLVLTICFTCSGAEAHQSGGICEQLKFINKYPQLFYLCGNTSLYNEDSVKQLGKCKRKVIFHSDFKRCETEDDYLVANYSITTQQAKLPNSEKQTTSHYGLRSLDHKFETDEKFSQSININVFPSSHNLTIYLRIYGTLDLAKGNNASSVDNQAVNTSIQYSEMTKYIKSFLGAGEMTILNVLLSPKNASSATFIILQLPSNSYINRNDSSSPFAAETDIMDNLANIKKVKSEEAHIGLHTSRTADDWSTLLKKLKNKQLFDYYSTQPHDGYMGSIPKEKYNNESTDEILVVGNRNSYMSIASYRSSILPILTGEPVTRMPCPSGLRMPNTTDCSKYYVCNATLGQVFSFSCPRNMAFNTNKRVCDIFSAKSCVQNISSSLEENRVIVQPVNPNKATPSRNETCVKNGKIPDVESANNYFVCISQRLPGSFKKLKYTCPKGLVFCHIGKMCKLAIYCSHYTKNVDYM